MGSPGRWRSDLRPRSRVLWEKAVRPDARTRGMPLTACSSRADGHTILVDTGLANKLSDKDAPFGIAGSDACWPAWPRWGWKAGDLDIVINTTFMRHCGGTPVCADRRFPPSRATYGMQRRELAGASYQRARTQATYRAANSHHWWRWAGCICSRHGVSRHRWECLITRGQHPRYQSIVIRSAGQRPSSWPLPPPAITWNVWLGSRLRREPPGEHRDNVASALATRRCHFSSFSMIRTVAGSACFATGKRCALRRLASGSNGGTVLGPPITDRQEDT